MRFLTVLLFLVIVVAGASFPSTMSQTFTNVLTTTGLFTTNSYFTSTIGTTTQTVVTISTITNATDTLQGGVGSACWYSWWNVTVDPGTVELTGTIGPPSSKIDFYIMNQRQRASFTNAGCGNTPNDAIVAVYGLTSTYALDWKNPSPGWYYFIFSNVYADLPVVTTSFVLVETLNLAETSALQNVVTNAVTISSVQTHTSVQAQMLTSVASVSASNGLGIDPTLVAGIIVGVIIICGALYFKKQRKERRRFVSQLACPYCRAMNPLGNGFCGKCGRPLDTTRVYE